MKITAYAIIGRKKRWRIINKKEKQVLEKEHVLYTGEPLLESSCECSYVNDVYLIFKTKREATTYLEYPPHPYEAENMRITKVIINYK